MKILCICHKGFESLAKKEIKQLIDADCTEVDGAVIFDSENTKDVVNICYFSQSLLGVIIFLKECRLDKIEVPDVSKYLNRSFVVRAQKLDTDILRQEIEIEIADSINTTARVDFKDPETTVLAYIVKDQIYIGIDLIGFDLSKRDYRIQPTPGSMKGSVYFNMLLFAEYNEGKKLLDFSCRSGSMVIEAALNAAGRSINYHKKDDFAFMKLKDFKTDLDKLDKKKDNKPEISAFSNDHNLLRKAQNNAKIAGVKKLINFSKVNIADLDMKFKEGTIDIISSYPLQLTKYQNEKKVEKFYDEVFYQTKFILSKDGNITLIALTEKTIDVMKKYSDKHGFILKNSLDTWKGQTHITFLRFEKN